MSNPPPELQLNFVDDEPPPVYTDVPELNDQDTPSPIVEMKAMMEKEPIDDSAIFGDAPASQPSPKAPRPRTPTPAPLPKVPAKKKTKEKPIRYNKDGSVRKPRQYTEEQRKAMSERMKKVRLEAGKNKTKKQEERAKEQKHKALLKAKRDMEIEEIEEKIKKKSQPKEQKPPAPAPAPAQSFTKEDLERAQFEAIAKYDSLRKERKAKKKQVQQVKQYQEDVKTNLRKELNWRDVAGVYSDCF